MADRNPLKKLDWPPVSSEYTDKETALFEAFSQENRFHTTIIVPAYNEEAALPLVLKALFQVIDPSYEVLVIDDGSTDKSVAVASQFPCRLIQHPRNMGKGAALRTGMEQAYGEKVIFIDADNTYPVEMIPSMVRLLDTHDLVRGIRNAGRENIPPINRIGNQVFDGIIKLVHAVEGGDLLSGMYGGWREQLLELDLESEGFAIEAEINVKATAHGLTCATLPITYVERVGDKKLKPVRDGLRILYRVLQLMLTLNPLTVFVMPGIALMLTGAVGLGWTLLRPGAASGLLPVSVHAPFVLGVIGTLGIQLIVFGLAVYEAGMAYGLRGRANRVLDGVSQTLRRQVFMIVGLVMGALGSFGLVWAALDMVLPVPDVMREPAMLILLSMSLLFGFQLLSSTAFLSALRALQSKSTRRILR